MYAVYPRRVAPSSLHHDRDGLRDLVAALVLGRDAHDPAWLEVGYRERMLDEPCLPRLGRAAVRWHRRAGEPGHERPIDVLWPLAVLEALGSGQIRRGDRQVAIVLERRRGGPVTAAPFAVTRQALGIGVEFLASSQALRRQGGRRGHGDGLDRTPPPEAPVQALDVLEDLEPLRDGHVLGARPDAKAAQAGGHCTPTTAHALRQRA